MMYETNKIQEESFFTIEITADNPQYLRNNIISVACFVSNSSLIRYIYSNTNNPEKNPFTYDVLEFSSELGKTYIPVPLLAKFLKINLKFNPDDEKDSFSLRRDPNERIAYFYDIFTQNNYSFYIYDVVKKKLFLKHYNEYLSDSKLDRELMRLKEKNT